MRLFHKIETVGRLLGSGGLDAVRSKLRDRRGARREKRWLERYGEISPAERDAIRRDIRGSAHRPLISILMPVYDVDERWLSRAIESVRQQLYDNWELCIADDCSPSRHVRETLERYAALDERIKVTYRAENGHISAASNSALELVTGEFTALLDHDDEITEDALFFFAKEVDEFPETKMIYSDEDVIREDGTRHSLRFKPAWSRDLFYSVNYVTHFALYRTDTLRAAGGFRTEFDGSQDYDLALRVIERIEENEIRHIPRILYHWRAIRGSVAYSGGEKPYAHERGREAIRDHFRRTGVAAEVHATYNDLRRVSYLMPDPPPSVSLIVTGEQSRFRAPAGCEIVTVDDSASDVAERLNAAASASRGEVLIFLDADMEVNDANPIRELVSFAIQPAIGVVGAKILGRNKKVEQTGIVLDKELSVSFAHRGFGRESAGNVFRNRVINNYSAVSISCMAVRREVFETVGGFDPQFRELFDVDLCLRIREANKRIVVLPDVELTRTKTMSDRPCSSEEQAAFRERWQKYGVFDPFCNSNLKRDGSFEIDL